MLVWILLFVLSAAEGGIVLKANHLSTTEPNQPLTIKCTFNGNNVSGYKNIISLIISKRKESSSDPVIVASATAFNSGKITKGPGFKGSGTSDIGRAAISTVSITIPNPTSEDSGDYKCDFNAIGTSDKPLKGTSSNLPITVDIKSVTPVPEGPIQLETSSVSVTSSDEHIKLTCSFNGSVVESLKNLVSLTISKRKDPSSNFVLVASANILTPGEVTKGPGFTGSVTANFVGINDITTLVVEISEPSNRDAGEYQCQFNAIDVFNKNLQGSTEAPLLSISVDVPETPIPDDITLQLEAPIVSITEPDVALTMTCTFNGGSIKGFKNLISLMINKRQNTGSDFELVASVSAFTPDEIIKGTGFTGSGIAKFGGKAISTFTIEIPKPTAGDSGEYRCEYNGIGSFDRQVKGTTQDPYLTVNVDIADGSLPEDIIELTASSLSITEPDVPLKITCEFNSKDVSDQANLVSLSIKKRKDEDSNFFLVASVSAFAPDEITKGPRFTGNGHFNFGGTKVSTFSIEMLTPTPDDSGEYDCEFSALVRSAKHIQGSTKEPYISINVDIPAEQANTKLLKRIAELEASIESTKAKMPECAPTQLQDFETFRYFADNKAFYDNTIYGVSATFNDTSFYIYTDSTMNFDRASEVCDSFSGFLAEINTEEELLFVEEWTFLVDGDRSPPFQVLVTGASYQQGEFKFQNHPRDPIYQGHWKDGEAPSAVDNDWLLLDVQDDRKLTMTAGPKESTDWGYLCEVSLDN